MRQKSLYAFYLKGIPYNDVYERLEQLTKERQPDRDKEKTEGFINFGIRSVSIGTEDTSKTLKVEKYIYLEFYRSDIKVKKNPLGGTYTIPVKDSIPIAITSDSPMLLMIFTPNFNLRDYILSELKSAISPEYRDELKFSQDFIEFLNVPEPEEWIEQVFKDEIEPRGRKGRKGNDKTHIIIEKFADPDERDRDLEKKGYVFRDYAEVVVSVEGGTVDVRIYHDGKVTAKVPGADLSEAIPLIKQALKVLKEAENRYYQLKKSVQGGEVNGEDSS